MIKRLLCLVISLCCLIPIYSTNRALIVGIGKYKPNTGWIDINGDSDVALIVPQLIINGFDKQNIKTLINSEATKGNIKHELISLSNSCRKGDTVYFHFSGHGQRVKDYNKDESKGFFDQSIVPYDACFDSRRGYNGENHLIDDELAPILNAIKVKLGKSGTLIVVIDACYSQGIDKGEEWDELNFDEEIIFHPRGTDDKFIPNDSTWLKSVATPKDFSQGAVIYVVSASRSSEMNFQYRDPDSKRIFGSLSFCVAGLLKKKAPFFKWIQYFNEEKGWKKSSPKYFPYQTPSVKVIP